MGGARLLCTPKPDHLQTAFLVMYTEAFLPVVRAVPLFLVDSVAQIYPLPRLALTSSCLAALR